MRILVLVLALVVGVTLPAAAQDGLTLHVKPSTTKVAPGAQVVIAVIFDHEPGWHIHTNKPVVPREWSGFTPIPTTIKPTSTGSAKAEFLEIQWPVPHEIVMSLGGPPAAYAVYEERAIAYVPVQVAADAKPGQQVEVRLAIGYQACDDLICLLPEEVVEVVRFDVVTLEELAGIVTPADPDFARFDVTIFATGKPLADSTSIPINFFGLNLGSVNDANVIGVILLLIVGTIGGFLLNLTPCVLPVVPLKIMGLSQAAGNPAKCFMLGLVLSLGMIAFFMAIGAAISFLTGFTAISSLFQTGWFAIAVGIFIFVMALGMFGLFTTGLPQWVYRITPKHETFSGAFVWGILMAVLSTPCTAPLMGAAAAWAATQPAVMTMTMFAAIGLGMAMPYIILSANPKWVSKVPRSGPASELVKQVMGLLLIAVAAYFLGTGLGPYFRDPVDPPTTLHWWIIGAAAFAAGVWLTYCTWRITNNWVKRGFWTIVGCALAASGVYLVMLFTDHGPVNWLYYTPQRLADARARGDVIVIDFTAEWCLNCKALEAAVLYRPDVYTVLNGPGVTPIKVDLSGGNTDGQALLKQMQWVGIPLLVIEGPGLSEPEKYDSYTVATVLDAIERARGSVGQARAP